MRYFFHIETREGISLDHEGAEFATSLEADDHGARIASEIGMDDGDYVRGLGCRCERERSGPSSRLQAALKLIAVV
jgi:hypothetical protein